MEAIIRRFDQQEAAARAEVSDFAVVMSENPSAALNYAPRLEAVFRAQALLNLLAEVRRWVERGGLELAFTELRSRVSGAASGSYSSSSPLELALSRYSGKCAVRIWEEVDEFLHADASHFAPEPD